MRVVFVLLFLVISGTSWFFYDDRELLIKKSERVARVVADRGVDLWRKKEIAIRGLTVLSEEEIRSVLPLERSTVWWHTHTEDILNRIRENALVQEVDLRACATGPSGWGCFIIDVRERLPGYVVFLGTRPWLVGIDGGFLYPLPAKSTEDLAGLVSKIAEVHAVRRAPTVVRGLFDEGTSPDIAKGRIEYIRLALEAIESESGFQVKDVTFSSNGELTLRFYHKTFGAVFDFAGEDFTRLKEEAKRLKRIVADFRGDIGTVDTIDLAFNRLAVIKLKK